MSLRQGFMIGNEADLGHCLDIAADAGFDYVELNMDYTFARQRTDAERVRTAAADRDLDVVAHLPYRLDAGSPRDSVREGSLEELQSAVDTAVEYGAEKGVFHLQTTANGRKWDTETVRGAMYDTADRLTDYATERGLEPVAENLKSGFFDAGDFPDLFAETDTAACLDTGHAFVSGFDGATQADLIRDHGDRISHVHLNDTRIDADDEHLPVGMGRVDFDAITTAMRETGWSGTCTHELFTFDRSYAVAGKERFDRLLADE